MKHEGIELVYDWGEFNILQTQATIGWVAFYSDCEHEVQQMQSGHRITLAYNFYIIDKVG